MQVTSIVPRLHPTVDGVGDYALNLARQLRADFNIETHFVVGDPIWPRATQMEGFPISQMTVRSAPTLLSLLSGNCQHSTVVLLHYVNYGYAKRGCPIWLVDGLQRWLALGINRVLVTMFHELYAFGPPWASSFWLSPLQKNLAGRIARLSDRCLTSKQLHAEILYQLSRGKHKAIPTLPVFSNIGEPEPVPNLAKREQQMVVFGGRSNRLKVYRESLAQLELACQLLEIEKILDIGPVTGLNLSTLSGVPIVERGQLSDTEISSTMLNSLAGFFNYPIDFLAKSTIFAAYCAHGLLPVSPQGNTFSVDGIADGKQYWTVDNQTTGLLDLEEVQAIADRAYTWYQTHNLSAQAKVFADHLTDNIQLN